MASVTGYPTVGQNYTGTNVGVVDWVNPSNVISDNGSFATVNTNNSNRDSKWLDTRTYGFSIPSFATITGIVVEVEIYDSNEVSELRGVQLLKGGTLVGSNLATSSTNPGVDTVLTFGSSTQLWGTTWSPSEVNSADFGVAFRTWSEPFESPTVNIDFSRLTIHYTLPNPQPAYPASAQNYTGTNVGTVDWTDPTNAKVNDSTYTTVTVSPTIGFNLSKWLHVNDFGFAIPSDSMIFGIVVEVDGFCPATIISVKGLQLIKEGSFVGSNKGNDTILPTSEGLTTFGGSLDVWGTTWTPAEINDSDFGVGIYVGVNGPGSGTVSVDAIKISVYHGNAFNGTAALSIGKSLRATGTFVNTPKIGRFVKNKPLQLVASGSMVPPGFNGSKNLSKPLTLRAVGSMVPPSFGASSQLNKPLSLIATGEMIPPVYSGQANLIIGLELAALGNRIFYGAELSKPLSLTAIGETLPPEFNGSANLSIGHTLNNTSVSIPPQFNGRAILSKGRMSLQTAGNSTWSIDSSLNLFISGKAPEPLTDDLDMFIEGSSVAQVNPMIVGSIPLYIDGAYLTNSSLNLFIEGYSVLKSLDSSLNLYLSADYPVATADLDLFLMADVGFASRSLPLYIKGDGVNFGYYYTTKSLNLFIEGTGDGFVAIPLNKSLDLFIKGVQPLIYSYNSSIPLYLKVADGFAISEDLDLFVEGKAPDMISADLDLVIYSTMLQNSLPLFVRGI